LATPGNLFHKSGTRGFEPAFRLTSPIGPKADIPGVERIIAQAINEAVRGDPDECRMKQLYRSPNGDTWFLARSPTTGLAFVRHQANTPSGGRLADIEIGTFLSGPRHPEQDALLRVIGASMVDPQGAQVVRQGRSCRIEAERPNRNSLARSVRAPSRWLVSPPRHHLAQAESNA
jgi:hypothetical protein